MKEKHRVRGVESNKNQTSSSMATTTGSIQLPCHVHPLVQLDVSLEQIAKRCDVCQRKIWNKAYTCQEGCQDHCYYHEACIKAPHQIDHHPLHPIHPLALIPIRRSFTCDACDERSYSATSSFRCEKCDFDLDLGCALSALSDRGSSQGGKTPEQITLPLHPHTLTSFSTRHDFVVDSDCYICQGSVEADGYICLRRPCKFVIHKRCIQDLYYADGTKAPRVYHGHPFATFVGEDTSSTRCARCRSDKSGEFIGCACCQVFYHRHCFQVPEILQYPSHNPDHTLVPFPDIDTEPQCESCSYPVEDKLYYRCTSCEFFVHVGCAFQVVTYCEEGMSAKIELSWHKHPLLLSHRTESAWNLCRYCWHMSIGPTYVCEEKNCVFLLHKKCTESKSTITHPHHPDHPLILCEGDDNLLSFCEACGEKTDGLKFSCKRCVVDLHVYCADRFPHHKHYLHEHKLLHFEEHLHFECNRCGRSTDSPSFRCVSCNFNLHEECMELPQVVESKIHWHPLTLYETFLEDDSGEYYCERCEKTRDPRLGAYVCRQCKISLPRIYHIECVLPELGKVYEKRLPPKVEKLKRQIADKRDEVLAMTEEFRAIKEKLEEGTRELGELEKQLEILLDLNAN